MRRWNRRSFRARSSISGIRDLLAQEITPIRSRCPSTPLVRNTCRSCSFIRYARYSGPLVIFSEARDWA